MRKQGAKDYVFLYANFLLYSLCGVFAKIAGAYPLLSRPALSLYFCCILVMGFYAVLWQQILKRFPLAIAYSGRAAVVIYGMLWGALLFKETIKWNMLLGAVVIICGVVLLVKHDE